MKSLLPPLFACLLLAPVLAVDSPAASGAAAPEPATLSIREIRYDGRLSDEEARFTVEAEAEATGRGESSVALFAGDVALLPAKLPAPLRMVREGGAYRLVASHPGRFKFTLDLVARIQRTDPWNQVSFTGPAATIASVSAQAGGKGLEVQMLSGTLLESTRAEGVSRVKGFLGSDPTVALRWSRLGGIAEVARKALLTVDSSIQAQITPTVIKYTSRFHYEIVQGNAAQLTLALPVAQALTRLAGEQIRDWRSVTDSNRQLLTIEFIKPVEKGYDLTLYSEQAVDAAPPRAATALNPPQPLEVERESGLLALSTEDTLIELDSLAGLRQVNAPEHSAAAYRFNARPFTLALKLNRIEPVIHVADRASARLEETRLIVTHRLALNVEKAGAYTVELAPPAGFAVAEVRAEGLEDWQVNDDPAAGSRLLRVNFSARVLGSRTIEVQLEQPLRTFPQQVALAPLRVTGAARETAQIGAAAAPGIRLKTGGLSGLREIPVNRLANPADELLAYTADQPDWSLSLASERLAARVVAEVFNLVTIGDGIVGGSATIRYGLFNQGVQEFKIKVPAGYRNVDFTGPNIRRKECAGGTGESNDVVWTVGLQDKVWGGYTLVVTYDHQFDPKGATLPVGGLHPLGIERETGSVAITTAASLQLRPETRGDTLRRVDEGELSAADRRLITRAVVLAYQYAGDQYRLEVQVKRYADAPVFEAVADRTQITSVLTGAGEMLTQASFMVKNNAKQSQRFQLPPGATLWGCYVNGQPAKPERDGEWVLVSLPRDVNRDQAFAVDIMYAEKKNSLASPWAQSLELTAPRTDVPNTYAEWQLFVPAAFRLSSFGGSMNVAQGTTYALLDAWEKFLAFYVQVLREAGAAILVIGFLAALVIALVISAVRHGWNGILTLLAVMAILAVLGAMLLPALSSAKSRAMRVSSMSNLKQIGLAAQLFAADNNDRLPVSLEEMMTVLHTDAVTVDPASGQRYIYLGGGLSLGSLQPGSVLAYSPMANGRCSVLMADGHVEVMTAARFGELSQRGLVRVATPQEIAANQQQQAILHSQLGAPRIPNLSGAEVATASAPATLPVAAGIRSIRIELPQSGQPFLFTKVLNVQDEPLSIRARIMPLRTFLTLQMSWQVAAFLLGLALAWWQWTRNAGTRRSSFVLALALALVIGSVCSLLIQWRALHDVLIVGFPVATVAGLAFLVWKFWPRDRRPASTEPPPLPGRMPPVTAVLALLLALNLAGASAAEPVAQLPAAAPGAASLVSASYSGRVNDRVAALDATFRFASAQPGQTIPLFAEDVAVQRFTARSGKAGLVRDGNRIALRLDSRGDVLVEVKLLVKVAGDVTRRRLAFGIPPALSSRVDFTVDQPEADVDFPTAISFKRELDKDATRAAAVMGSGDRVELLWTPRVKRAAEVTATVFCQNASLVTFGGGLAAVRAVLDYQVTQGELRQARVQLPAGHRLLRVEGLSIRTWEIRNDNGAQVLVVDLLKGIPLGWRLAVETEKVLETLPVSTPVEVPHALDVKRETGWVALRHAEEVGLSVESVSELQRVDAEEFARSGTDKADGLFSVFRFSQPGFALRVRAESIQPHIEAVARNYFRVGAEQVALSARIDYTIKRGGVFALQVALPEGYRVEAVSGDKLLQWLERSDTGSARRLDVTLKERTSGAYSLRIELVRNLKSLPASLPIAGVHPLDTAKLTGFVGVSAEPGVALKTQAFEGLTEIPAIALPDGGPRKGEAEAGGMLAYKFISAEPKAAPEWALSVATEAVEAWVRAEIVSTITLTEMLVSGRAQVRFDIANAPVKELRLQVPSSFTNVEISGPNIRSREQVGDIWRVELQGRTRGFYTLTVTWDQPRASRTGRVDVAGVSAAGVERETGLIAIVAKAPLQVSELAALDLQRVDTGDLPDWAGRADPATALVYRYVRPGYELGLDARRFSEAEVLQALVDSARLTTVVAEDGQTMTEMALSVRNNGRQFLEVELPPGARVWSAFVAGQPVRPSQQDGKLLLPIAPSGTDGGPVSVELTYAGTNRFPVRRGQAEFVSPKFDVPLKNARWELLLPPDYAYEDFDGTMTREVAAARTSALNFSLLDYTRMEKATLASAQAEVRRDVSEAQRQLAGGNVREATANFNRAKGKSYGAADEDAEVKKLEKELNSAQASNLILAQSEFVTRNSGSGLASPNAPALVPQPGQLYDNSAAEQQWARLQQAQEVVAAAVQPLHVNLPLRGQAYAFTQVLQTETGKPMVVRMLAASTRSVSWPMRILTVAAGFLVLWGFMALVLRATRRHAVQPDAALQPLG